MELGIPLPETSPSETEAEKARKKREKLAKRGLLKTLTEGPSDKKGEKPETLLERLRGERDKRKAEQKGQSPESANDEATEQAKRAIVREHIQEEIAELEVELAQTDPGSVAHLRAVAKKEFLERVIERTEDDNQAIDPAIEEEFQARMVAAQQELAEQQEGNPAIPTTPEAQESPSSTNEKQPRHDPVRSSLKSVDSQPLPEASLAETSSGTVFPTTEIASQEKERLPTKPSPITAAIVGYAAGRNNSERTSNTSRETSQRLQAKVAATELLLKKRREQPVDRAESLDLRSQKEPIAPVIPTARASKPWRSSEAGIQPNNYARSESASVLNSPIQIPTSGETEQPPHGSKETTSTAERISPIPSINKETEQQIAKVDRLATPDILRIAETISLGGTTARRLYETNQIDRAGLEKIVKTSLRGGDVRAVFESVELGRERQRERAKEFRHEPTSGFLPNLAVTSALAQTTPQPTALPPAQTLPNQPNPGSLQPVSTISKPEVAPIAQPTLEVAPTRNPLKEYLTPLLILGFGITLLLLWLVF